MRELVLKIKKFLIKMPLAPTMVSMGWNFVYGLINGLIAVIFRSYWYTTMCAYYLLLGFMRFSAVTVRRSKRRSDSDMLLHSGLSMIILAIILCGMMVITIREHQNPVKDKIVMLIIALYTFVFVVISIRNIVIAHKKRRPVLLAVRNISCASAIGAIISLERGMIGTFGDGIDADILLVEEITGGIAVALIVGLGIGLILLSRNFARFEGPDQN